MQIVVGLRQFSGGGDNFVNYILLYLRRDIKYNTNILCFRIALSKKNSEMS